MTEQFFKPPNTVDHDVADRQKRIVPLNDFPNKVSYIDLIDVIWILFSLTREGLMLSTELHNVAFLEIWLPKRLL